MSLFYISTFVCLLGLFRFLSCECEPSFFAAQNRPPFTFWVQLGQIVGRANNAAPLPSCKAIPSPPNPNVTFSFIGPPSLGGIFCRSLCTQLAKGVDAVVKWGAERRRFTLCTQISGASLWAKPAHSLAHRSPVPTAFIPLRPIKRPACLGSETLSQPPHFPSLPPTSNKGKGGLRRRHHEGGAKIQGDCIPGGLLRFHSEAPGPP